MPRNIRVSKRFTFGASHFLEDYDGPCANLHGHNYVLEVRVKPNPGVSDRDMVMDFSILKKIVQKVVLDQFDHVHLNHELDYNPTAENMASDIFARVDAELEKEDVFVDSIKLWETEGSWAEVIR